MTAWIILLALLAALSAGLAVACLRLKERLKQREAELLERAQSDDELHRLRMDDVRRRREIAALNRRLEDAFAESDRLDAQLSDLHRRAEAAEARAQQAEKRRIAAEKDVSAGEMKARLLEKQYAELEQNQLAQERLYQDILREKETLIEQLQAPPRRRAHKKPDALDRQITFSDLLKGE